MLTMFSRVLVASWTGVGNGILETLRDASTFEMFWLLVGPKGCCWTLCGK